MFNSRYAFLLLWLTVYWAENEARDADTMTSSMAVPPWLRALERSIKQNKSDRTSSWVQLATIKPNGRPAVRTVVHRGIIEEDWVQRSGPILSFITDARSEKVQQIESNASCELAWYFSVTREQWRISGVLSIFTAQGLIGANDGLWNTSDLESARLAAWGKMSDAGRAQFVWPGPGHERSGPDSDFIPSLPLPDSASTNEHPVHDRSAEASLGYEGEGEAVDVSAVAALANEGYSNFALMLLQPDACDYLCLKYAPTQRRVLYSSEVAASGNREWIARDVNP